MEKISNTPPKVIQILHNFRQKVGDTFLLRCFALVLMVFVSAFIFSLISPAAGEAWVYNLVLFSGIMTAGLLAIIAAVGGGLAIELGAIFAGIGIEKAREKMNPKELPAGEQYSISPDLLVWQEPGEPDNTFADRLNAAMKNRGEKWIAAIRFQDTFILVDDNTKEGFYTARNDESIGLQHTEPEGGFVVENEQQYYNYLHAVCPKIRAAFAQKKMKQLKTHVMSPLLKTLNVVLFLLLSLSATAQNTNQVVNLLGDKATDKINGKVRSGVTVRFTFDKGTMQRTATGDKTIAELVTYGRPGSDGIDYGRLNGVDTNGVAVAPGKTIIPADGNFDKPKPLFTTRMEAPHNEAVPQKSFGESLPDSATVARNLTYVQDALPTYKQKIRQFFMPIIDFMSALLLFFSPLFAIVLGLCNLVSRSAASNGNLGELVRRNQVKFAAFAWWISVLLYSCIYLGVTFSLFFWECHPLIISVVCFLLYLPAEWVINWLTPNGQFRASKHGKPPRGGGGYPELPG